MTANVVNLHNKQPVQNSEPIEALVLMLEDLLREAKSGKLRTFNGVGFLSDGNRLVASGPQHTNLCEMLGALEMIKQDMMKK